MRTTITLLRVVTVSETYTVDDFPDELRTARPEVIDEWLQDQSVDADSEDQVDSAEAHYAEVK